MRPVENVSWDTAQTFCRRLTNTTGATRLPSEAEWSAPVAPIAPHPSRLARRSPPSWRTTTACSPFGQPAGVYRHAPTAAGSFPPNTFGLHDMHGNLWEWCADPWHETYDGAPADGVVWTSGGHPTLPRARAAARGTIRRIVCRSAVRLKLPKTEGDDFYGFHVAMSLPDERMPA